MREGKARRTGSLTVRMCSSPLSHARVGIVVPRYGHTAVERNRLKRQLRELVRLELLGMTEALDVLIHCSGKSYLHTFETLRAEIENVRLLLSARTLESS